jgi:hypothetical protein
MTDGARSREHHARDLAEALVRLGPALDLGPDPGSAFAFAVTAAVERLQERPVGSTGRRAGVRARIRSWLLWQRPARRALVLAVALVVALAVAAAAATLGVRGVRLIFGPPPASSAGPPSSISPTASASSGPIASGSVPTAQAPREGFVLGTRVSLEEARARVAFDVTLPSFPELGRPAVYLTDAAPGGAVTLVYPSGPGIPPEGDTDIGISITEFVGRVDRTFMTKYIQAGTTVRDVDVGGIAGLWVAGAPHQVAYVGADGSFLDGSFRFSGPALLWQLGDVTLRLESVLGERRAVQIAALMR